jgi:mannose-6-phosphate isomerase-like protein (cupin superfamily)
MFLDCMRAPELRRAQPADWNGHMAQRNGNAVVKLAEKLAAFDEQWSPRLVARLNDYEFKVVKVQGEFVWHSHADTDEAFLVLAGELRIELRDGAVRLGAGDLYVVPRGVEHRPCAERECQLLLIEPAGTPNTGNAGGERTREAQWI